MYRYEFNVEDARRFASENGYETKHSGDELIFTKCPYCGERTSGDKDKFSINLKTGQFQCFRASCGARGNMLTLANDFNFSLGREWDDYYKLPAGKIYKRLVQPKEKIIPKDFAIEYMAKRGISEDIVRRYQITTRNDMPTVLSMPFFDEENKMQFVKYRITDPAQVEKFGGKEYSEPGCKAILYGMNCCNLENHTLIITEGQIDSLSLAEAGIENAVSVPTGANGFTWLPHCWNWMKKNFNTIIVFGDHEKGHITLLDELNARLGSSILIKHVKEDDYRECKDANEILQKYGKEQLRTCVKNAVKVKNEALIDISSVKRIDISEIDKIRTHIPEIDSLVGGICLGGLTVITGKAGEGKSTFASQILAYAVNQDYKCMAYSGELPNGIFKDWLYLQIAGKEHIHVNDKKESKIEADVYSKINSWIAEKLYLYDIDKLFDEDNEELPALVETVEQAIIQYGCRVILLDNLMTALDLVASSELMLNKYEAQAHFVRTLASMARKYNVAIILIAHKRKNNGTSIDVNDEISGSSDITNYASMIISYGKYSQNEIEKGIATSNDRKMAVSKERFKGKTAFDCKLCFEPNSKRIFSPAKIPDVTFGWEKEKDGSTAWEELKQIDLPFS